MIYSNSFVSSIIYIQTLLIIDYIYKVQEDYIVGTAIPGFIFFN